ncbi:MAG: DedA family protein, partial [Chitinispirillaceae bacterium]|nr:DedA family protein [Chitinispirillaceae bacterium]
MEFITGLIENYGYIIVTLSILVESMGVPMPGETALVVAAAFAGSGHLNIALVIVCAATGAIIGDSGGYWIGRKLGRPFVEKHGKWLHLTAERMAKLEDLFVKHGPKTVFFGRFFSLLRTYAALFAGIWRMPYRTFMIYNALGGIVWAIVFGVLGFVFGQNLPLLERIARTIGWALTIPFVLIVSLSLAWHWTVRHQSALIDRWKSFADRSFIGRFRRAHASQITAILRRLTAAQYTVVHIAVGLVFACAGVWI